MEKSGATIEIVGDARIVDGDTIVIQDGKGGKERIRLLGIDAPESKQVIHTDAHASSWFVWCHAEWRSRLAVGVAFLICIISLPTQTPQVCKDGKGGDYACGIESQQVTFPSATHRCPFMLLADRDRGSFFQALQKLVGNDKVKCLAAKRDMYQRILGVCYDARTGVELNKAMVDEGEAIAYTAYSKAYATEEETAKSKRTGVWRGEFQKPWEYRKMKRSAARDAKTVQVKKTPKAAVAPASR